MVGTARCAVPARVAAGGTNNRAAGIRRSCAAARGADIAARCPYHANRYQAESLRHFRGPTLRKCARNKCARNRWHQAAGV